MTNYKFETDYLIIGSGASGSVIYNELKKNNLEVILVEKGSWFKSIKEDKKFINPLKKYWKKCGYQITNGTTKMPILQGCGVGGSTIINGAIMQEISEKYINILNKNFNHPSYFKMNKIYEVQKSLINDFEIKKNTEEAVLNSKIFQISSSKGWKADSQLRAAKYCKFTESCLNGCPSGGKQDVAKKLLDNDDKNILSKVSVLKILTKNSYGNLILCKDENNKKFYIKVKKKIILCAGAIDTPKIIFKSKIKNNQVGKNFTCHLSSSITGLMKATRKELEGLPMGYQIKTNDKFLKTFFSQSIPDELILSKVNLLGKDLINLKNNLSYTSSWVASTKSDSRGEIKKNIFGNFDILFNPSLKDLEKVYFSHLVISNFLFELGAIDVFLPFSLKKSRIKKLNDYPKFSDYDFVSKNFILSSSHIFGSCSINSDNNKSAIKNNFLLKGTKNIYVADSSALYEATEYNPQLAIMVIAKIASEVILND